MPNIIRRVAARESFSNGKPLAGLTGPLSSAFSLSAFLLSVAAHAGGVPGPMPALPSLPPINPGLSSDCVAALDPKAHGAEAARAAHRCSRPAQPGDRPLQRRAKRAAPAGTAAGGASDTSSGSGETQ